MQQRFAVAYSVYSIEGNIGFNIHSIFVKLTQKMFNILVLFFLFNLASSIHVTIMLSRIHIDKLQFRILPITFLQSMCVSY